MSLDAEPGKDPDKVPDHFNLAQLRRAILEDEVTMHIDALAARTGSLLRVRFLDAHGKELPDDTQVGVFRALAALGKAHIVIDDGQGGTPVKPKVPELT
jgi:hypothetical protein